MSTVAVADYSDVKEVVTVSHDYEVNAYLKKGWVLLDKYVMPSESGNTGFIRFVMAWRQESAPDKPSGYDFQVPGMFNPNRKLGGF